MEALDIHDGDDASAGAKVRWVQLDLLLARLGGAVASAPTASRLLALTERGPDAAGLAAALGSDPDAGAFLIAFARRGPSPRTVADVGDAAEALGADGVWAALLGRCVLRRLGPSCRTAGLDAWALWRHALAVGAAAEAVARRLGREVPPALAFVCGLAHDLGKFALGACVPKSYQRVLGRTEPGRGDIAEFERQVIGIDHSAAGRRVAQRWRLGATVAEVVRLHHHPPEAMPSSGRVAALAQAVQLADILARERGLGFSGNFSYPRSGEALAEALGLPAGALDAVGGELDESFDRLRAAAEAHPDGCVPTPAPETDRTAIPVPPEAPAQATPAERVGSLLRDVLAAATPTTPLPTLCGRLARAFSAAADEAGAGAIPPAWTTGAFVVAPDGERAILAVHGGPETGAYRFTACRTPLPECPTAPAPAREVLAGLLAEPEAWSELIDVGGAVCWPLVAGGETVGGVCLPEALIRRPDRRQAVQALGELAAPVVGLALGQAKADDLADRLRGVSQRLAETRRALAQAEALAAVGEMAAGAAHEINNPLAVIAGRAQLLARQSRTKKAREAAELIARKAHDVSDIVTDLMEFAHPPAPTASRVAAADLLAGAREAASRDATASAATVDTHVAAGCPPAWADAEQMADVLLEAVRNAAEAAGGAVRVRIDAAPAGAAGVVFRVADDGPGMDAATLAQAFTPFFSRRPAGRRRGMGLSRARRRVQANGGHMWIDSAPGQGTTVHVRLPQAPSEDPGDE